MEQFIDIAEMGVNEDMQPDSFYFDQALKVFARGGVVARARIHVPYLTANHFRGPSVYRPELTAGLDAAGQYR